MQSDKWKAGNQGVVVAVLLVVGVVTVGAIGWLFIDRKLSSNSWLHEKVFLEKSLVLAQAEKGSLQKELEELRHGLQLRVEAVQASGLKLDVENRLLTEEKTALSKEIALLKEKLAGVESNTFFSDLIKERAELEVAVGELKSSVGEKEKEIAQLKQKQIQLAAELNAGGKSESFLQKQLNEKEKVNQLLSKYMANEKKQSQELRLQMETANAEKVKLARQLEQLVSEKELAQKKLSEISTTLETNAQEKASLQAKLDSVYDVINDRLGEIVRVKKALETTLDDTKALVEKEIDEIELEPIVVRATSPAANNTRLAQALSEEAAPQRRELPSIAEEESQIVEQVRKATLAAEPKAPSPARSSEAALTKELVGRVLVVNEKLNFIVVNLGANQGVQVGMKLAVVKDNSIVADTQVIEVRDNIAAADIQNLKLEGAEINEGDYVRIGVGS